MPLSAICLFTSLPFNVADCSRCIFAWYNTSAGAGNDNHFDTSTQMRLREKAEREEQDMNSVADAIIAATLDWEARDGVKTRGDRAWEIYYQFRDKIETPENTGKMIIVDVNNGDYENASDELCLAETEKLRARHSDVELFGLPSATRRLSHFAATWSACRDRRGPFSNTIRHGRHPRRGPDRRVAGDGAEGAAAGAARRRGRAGRGAAGHGSGLARWTP